MKLGKNVLQLFKEKDTEKSITLTTFEYIIIYNELADKTKELLKKDRKNTFDMLYMQNLSNILEKLEKVIEEQIIKGEEYHDKERKRRNGKRTRQDKQRVIFTHCCYK